VTGDTASDKQMEHGRQSAFKLGYSTGIAAAEIEAKGLDVVQELTEQINTELLKMMRE
jgi:hypothetical protein